MAHIIHKPIRILQITDLHLKADPAALWRGHNVQDSLTAILQLASEQPHWPPEVILVTGDIVDDETPEGYRQTYQRLTNQLHEKLGQAAARTTRIGLIPGNHDNPAILEDSCSELGIQGCGAFSLGSWQIIQLDSTLPDSDDGELGAVQLEALDNSLSDSSAPHRLIVLHHPLIKLGSQWLDSMRVKDGDVLFERVDRFNQGKDQVRAIIWGHAHQQTEQLHNQIRLYGTPAAGPVQFTVASDEFAIDTELQAGLRWLILTDDGGIETSVQRLTAKTH